jgi:hypothetical protein
MRSVRFAFALVLGAGLVSVPLAAQMVVSAKSGLVHYVEGDVVLGDDLINPKIGHFPDMKEGQVLRTEAGRAEVLLNPGVFMRLAENSSVKMLSNRLVDTRLDVLSGTVMIEVAEMTKEQGLTLAYKDAAVEIRKKGLYRINGDAGTLQVYDGEAVASLNGQSATLKDSKETTLTGVLAPEKFSKDDTDAFYRWAARRSNSLAVANLSAAKSLRDSGSSWTTGGWNYNPMFGLFTFIPGTGYYNSPFGYAFYSPFTVYNGLYYYGRGGYLGGSRPVYNGGNPVYAGNSGGIANSGRAMTSAGPVGSSVSAMRGPVASAPSSGAISNGGGVAASGGISAGGGGRSGAGRGR